MSVVLDRPPSTPYPVDPLAALRAINFDWTMHLRSVWSDPAYDSPELHTELRQEFQDRLDEFKATTDKNSPLGWLVVGAAGSGKTHWLSICRKQAVARGIGFVLVDMTGVRDFWHTVLQGYLDSLQQEYEPGKFQQQVLLERFLALLPFRKSTEEVAKLLPLLQGERLGQTASTVIEHIRRKHPREALQHHDVIRALFAVSSQDAAVASAGLSWLNGNLVEDEMRRLLGFTLPQQEPRKIVQALSWMMSLCGPTILAFDQLDPIVAELDPAAKADGREESVQGLRALAIIQEIANGLGAVRDVCYRTLSVVSCLETTIAALRKYTLQSWQDRFEDARALPALSSAAVAESILAPRVFAAAEKVGWTPPYPTWPILPAALAGIQGVSPRNLLKQCEKHRKNCLAAKTFVELERLESLSPVVPSLQPDLSLDAVFEAHRRRADVAALLAAETEDERFAPLLINGARCLLRELSLPNHLDAQVDEFPGGATTKPLHVRIRLVDHHANDRERHFCFRALGREHALAFQSRLRGVMNGSGIDRGLPFRHAVVLRGAKLPGGSVTAKLVGDFQELGGKWHKPTDDEVRTLFALKELQSANPDGFTDWLKARRPASQLAFFQPTCAGLLTAESPPPRNTDDPPSSFGAAIKPPAPQPAPVVRPPQPQSSAPPPRSRPNIDKIPVGNRTYAGKTEPQFLDIALLEKHTVVLAGAGSGKTVLLKRIIEEAALAGVPSIVIDGANDLAALGLRRPSVPVEWLPGDQEKAARYHSATEVVVWTPGREAGNPLCFEPLPDLAALADSSDELTGALDMIVESIGSLLAAGKSQKTLNKHALVRSSLKFLARHGAVSIPGWIELLREFPAEAGVGIEKEGKLAREMADALIAGRENSPLLRGQGQGLDCARLFGDEPGASDKTRISIINFCGLPSGDTQQLFLNQLALTLFAWIKKNPNPPGRKLRGLLVIDEAKDFVPATASTACKAALSRLAAQARKYHLGIIFATQNPREIDNKIIGNCSTHFYGKANSPVGQDAIRDQMRQKGGDGADIGNLPRGVFYFHNADAGLPQPVKLHTALCLSEHRPLEEPEVLQLAADSRRRADV